ncbi:protein SICKLE-like isoform X1 [Carya illinoinensis]|uniref:protein SICKLE-like isoform X1 n=1 Tax=Carya illinoinensis TaxID=32201 RepID=UPI001C7189A7|nr:protein SICKLE-like isoform X1 [Carya illinoinensis]XP_042988074.1 protein SICKLE-like isoform X1 [Carya illinoinensis]
MEESAKRRVRLKAMRMQADEAEVPTIRMQADQAEVPNNAQRSGMPGCLSNPLVETATTEVWESYAPRFDFYTDPMSAFSDSRKSSKAGNQIGPDCFSSQSNNGPPMSRFSPSLPVFIRFDIAGPRNTSLAHQNQSNWSPNQIMYQPQGMASPHQSPVGTASPFSMHPQTPEFWNGSTGPTSYSSSSNPSRGGHLPSPGFGPRGSPYSKTGQGRGYWASHSPSPGSPRPTSGRGGSRWYGSSRSPGLGQSSGQGRGSHARFSAPGRPLGPEQFYYESMLEDPWKFSKPVMWQSMHASGNYLNTPDSSRNWTTKSHSTKKARASEALNKSSNQPSLAEYLAASFKEAVDDGAST